VFPLRYGRPAPRRWPIPEPAKSVIENAEPWTYYRIFQLPGVPIQVKVEALEVFCAVPRGTVSGCFPEVKDTGIVGRLMRERFIEMKMILDKKSRAAGRSWPNDAKMWSNAEGDCRGEEKKSAELIALEG